jgi:hypothetical protein
MDNNKQGTDNVSGGRSLHCVKHVYLCLYCILYLLFHICFILLLCDLVFLTTGIRAKGNSQEKRAPSSRGSNDRRWKF